MATIETRKEEIEKRLFETLEKDQKIEDTQDWAHKEGIEHKNALVGLLKAHSLEGGALRVDQFKKEMWELTDSGKDVLANGSPELRLLRAVPKEGSIAKADLQKEHPDLMKSGFAECMKNKWIVLAGPAISRAEGIDVEAMKDTIQDTLRAIESGEKVPDKKDETILKNRRKLIRFVSVTSYKVELIGSRGAKAVGDLTTDMLRSGSWKEAKFKQYNFEALGAPLSSGYVHPLSKMRQQMRQIFLEMGFSEMPTSSFVESSFWNFDSLFQPQQHPARDMHDTFFLKDPQYASDALDCPADYCERVKKMHEEGGDGSIGWRYKWSREESLKNIFRTHTTASSSHMLFRAAEDYKKTGVFKPIKCFSIDRVFRNETLDATHLAEFHQVEGFIADYNVGLPHIIGVLTEFFNKLGMTDLRFKPAFNPYTEPSTEIYAYCPSLDKTIEIGNSGVFRPEMLSPMGIPDDIKVIAWGLSLERPTMIMYDIPSIRSLFGPACSLEFIRGSPICVLDK